MKSNIQSFFGEKGRLAEKLPGFSVRPQQQAVAKAIDAAMDVRGGVSIVEAATGVGKTLSYLIPAIRRASPQNKVVISTHTLALQSQLLEKDLPFLQSIWPSHFDAAVLKGRGNYLCLQDYEAARMDLWTIGDQAFADVGAWSKATETGDVAELDFTYSGWIDIRANPDTCKGSECRHYDRCFYYNMRRNAQDASILVVNHALFFTDLVMRQRGEQAALLPDYSFVIFDEAQHLESTAAAAFGVSFTSSRLPGLIEKIRRLARQIDIDRDRLGALETLNQALFSPFADVVKQEYIVAEVISPPQLQNAREQVAGIGLLLDGLATELLKQDTSGSSMMKDRIDGFRRLCVRTKEELTLVFSAENDNFLRWGAQYRGGRRGVTTTLNWTPISVTPLLGQALWEQPREIGAALLSATLSTDGGFAYMRERLGIPSKDPAVTETIVGSNFDYASQALCYIPKGLPPPSEDSNYMYQVVNEIVSLIEASQGGAFVLFTSHRALNAAYEKLIQSELPYPILRQGEMPNARLVEAFKSQKNSILLGAASFWEGVDIPGSGLRLVIIDRIPFTTPDNPLHKARVAQITAAGGDWFNDYALPQAQLKLKQGFGRLVRTASDRGVVAILDSRMTTKSYGHRIMRFLPPAKRTSSLQEVREFFEVGTRKDLMLAKVEMGSQA